MNNRLYGQHKIQKLLKELERRRINGWVIDTLEKDLDYEENEKILLEYIETSLFREKIIKAMEISKKAHTGQTQKGLRMKKVSIIFPTSTTRYRLLLWPAEKISLLKQYRQVFYMM